MVNWNDPAILAKDYAAVTKLNHVIAGIYIWETLLSANFELDIFRGNRPYRRTIWLYLGTRYSGLLSFVMILIMMDIDSGDNHRCQLTTVAFYALAYASWGFASLLIVLRIIAIWNRSLFMSSLAIGTWLVGLALIIYGSTELRGFYNPVLGACFDSTLRKYLINAAGILVIELVLLTSMLIGLLRCPHSSSTGLWHLLYQQCIIWLVLAAIAQVPLLVLLVLNLNAAIDAVFIGIPVAIVSIGAARMYRSLFQHAFTTEYVSSKIPQVSLEKPTPNAQHRTANVCSNIHFAPGTQSSVSVTRTAVSVFTPTGDVQSESGPGISIPELVLENMEERAGIQMA